MYNIVPYRRWIRWGIVNLAIVALYGALMRYKIAFYFPVFDQKNLLHAHSHFAFSGWISHILYSGLALLITQATDKTRPAKYNWLIGINLVCASGMLIAFTVQGYKAISITFSTLSLVIALLYAYYFIKDARYLPQGYPSKPWAVTGVLLNVLSAAGPISLAYMMASKNINPDVYLGSVYYYLHFQYNGWFFFGSMALVAPLLPKDFPGLNKYFRLFALTVIPTLFLSLLWAKVPAWLYVLTVVAAWVQLTAWIALVAKALPLLRRQSNSNTSSLAALLLYAAAIAMTLKFLLQGVSVIPSLSQLVFGFRPIVIAYLHLVLLGVYSLFILGYSFRNGYLQLTRMAKLAASGFFAGVLLNEMILGIQGMASFTYTPVPYINELLWGAAVVLCVSATLLACSQYR
jgi:hypothetical protein